MVQLSETHRDIYAEFMQGNFVFQKSLHKFSLIAKDQSHEQSHKTLQAHGGADELYENSDALTLFMLTGQAYCRCIKEFENVLDSLSHSIAHHEEAPLLQVKYHKDVLSLIDCVNKLGNQFLTTG